jgi:hypothetical protein
MVMEVAQQTINMIHGQLGSAQDHAEGYEVSGHVQGQRVDKIHGAERYTPTTFGYTARVVSRNERREWDISSIKPVS